MSVPIAQTKVTPPALRALRRDRIVSRLASVWDRSLAVVVAPAGYGKTTAIADFIASTAVPAAWYRIEAWDSDEAGLLAHVERALQQIIPDVHGPWTSVPECAEALEHSVHERAILVFDDVHTIEDSPAEQGLERLIECAPAALAIVVAGRAVPGFNMPRLRMLDNLVEVYADDLRFRQWEVEQLFQHCYGQRLEPDELAHLTRRTDGWAAGLQLFHLATRDKAPGDRRKVLDGLSSHSHLVREFLTRNVLSQLPADLREFLIATPLLGQLTGELCDVYLSRTDSSSVLLELERRRLFMQRLDVDSKYRYHEVLRSHLEAMLADSVGETALRGLSARAGRLLEERGAFADALRAYARAEDSEAANRVLSAQGSRLAREPGRWIDRLPPALLDNDPWLLLALARRHGSAGRPRQALDTYRRAERAFKGSVNAERCRDERMTLQAWIDPDAAHPRDGHWLRLLHTLACDTGTLESDARDTAALAMAADAVRQLTLGNVQEAQRIAAAAQEKSDASDGLHLVACIVVGIASLLMHEPEGLSALRVAEEHAERAGAGWLSRLARAAGTVADGGDGAAVAAAVRKACLHDEDRWGEAIAALFEGVAALDRGEAPVEVLSTALDRSERLHARAIATWARSLKAFALARRGDVSARGEAIAAQKASQRNGIPAAAAYAGMALAIVEPDGAAAELAQAQTTIARTGLRICLDASDNSAPLHPAAAATVAPTLTFSVFGSLRVELEGRAVDLTQLKPRSRALLRLLAAHGGEPVHREVLCEALWPDALGDTAMRSLQVAVSSLRQVLDPVVASGRATVVIRDGASYRLPNDEQCRYDVNAVSELLDTARATVAQDPAAAAETFMVAADRCAASLLPEDGPTGWAVELREKWSSGLLLAAENVARGAVAQRSFDVASAVCRRALDFDRYRDELWRLLLTALDASGKAAAGVRERHRYAAVLEELGVEEAQIGARSP